MNERGSNFYKNNPDVLKHELERCEIEGCGPDCPVQEAARREAMPDKCPDCHNLPSEPAMSWRPCGNMIHQVREEVQTGVDPCCGAGKSVRTLDNTGNQTTTHPPDQIPQPAAPINANLVAECVRCHRPLQINDKFPSCLCICSECLAVESADELAKAAFALSKLSGEHDTSEGPGDERTAFEEFAREKLAYNDLRRDDIGRYRYVTVQSAWKAWQARAALDAPGKEKK